MKRRKKYNSNLKFQSLSKMLARRYKLVLIQGEEKYIIPFFDDKEIKKWSLTEAKMLADVRHKWSILVGAVCRDQFGKVYIKSLEVSIQNECLSSELDDVLAKYQEELFETVNKQHFLTAFWIARPVHNYVFTEEEAMQIIESRDVLNQLITRYEHEQNQKI